MKAIHVVVVRGLLGIILLPALAAAAPLNWTGGAAFVKAPTCGGAFGQEITGTCTYEAFPMSGGPNLTNTPGGFKITDARLKYVSTAHDVGILIKMSWKARRPFNSPQAVRFNKADL